MKQKLKAFNAESKSFQVSAQQPDCLAKVALTCYCRQVATKKICDKKGRTICDIMCCSGGGPVGRNVGGSSYEPDKESGKGKGGEEGTGTAGGGF